MKNAASHGADMVEFDVQVHINSDKLGRFTVKKVLYLFVIALSDTSEPVHGTEIAKYYI